MSSPVITIFYFSDGGRVSDGSLSAKGVLGIGLSIVKDSSSSGDGDYSRSGVSYTI
jgi:hypothetical protein